IGGNATAPIVVYEPGKRPPVIQSRRSAVQELFAGVPDLMIRVMDISDHLTKLLDDDNRVAVHDILKNTEQLSRELAGRSDKIGSMIDNFAEASVTLNRMATAVGSLMDRLDRVASNADRAFTGAGGTLGKLDKVVDAEVGPMLRELRQTAKSFAQMSE